MAHLKKWTAVAAGGAALTLAGVIGVGSGFAGAAPSNDPMRHSAGTVSHNAIPFKPGKYSFFVNGANDGKIKFAAGNTFTAAIDGDSGTWVQTSNTAGMVFTGGSDAAGGCVFAGHVNDTGLNISTAAKPGNWACPGFGSSGTFYIAKASGATASQAHGNVFARADAVPANAGPIVPGTYLWTEDGYYSGNITIASGNTYTSTLSGNDAGAWAQAGSAFAFSISSGVDSGIGCLEVGKVNASGTAVGTSAHPGNWACPGTGTTGTFVIS